jgi:V8-like Glu-specific endopeptidase
MKIKSFLTLAFIVFALVQTYGQNCDLNATKDRRQQVEVVTKPFSNVVQIDMRRGKTYHGTGFFIHPRVLLTAGHNLRKRPQFIFTRVKSVTLRVGATSPNNYIAKETLKTIQNQNIFTVESFNKNYNIYEDFGVIILPDETLYNKIGSHFKLTVINGDSIPAEEIHIAGYPGDKPYCSMWTDKTKNFFPYFNENNNPDKLKYLKYDFTTETGLSGGPIWFTDNNIDHVFAIHTYGNNNDDMKCNTATLITPKILNQIVDFCKSKGIELNN